MQPPSDVLNAALPAVLASASTLLGVLLTLVFTNRREAKRQAHELDLKRMELQHQEAQRARDQRAEAYGRFLAATSTFDPATDAPLRQVAELVSRIELFSESEEVLTAVHRAVAAYYRLDQTGRKARRQGSNPGNDSFYVEGHKRLDRCRNDFFKAAKRDLGLRVGDDNPDGDGDAEVSTPAGE